MTKQPSFEGKPNPLSLDREMRHLQKRVDILGCQAASFEWVESYDTKDWTRLSKCIAPVLRVRLDKLCIPLSPLIILPHP